MRARSVCGPTGLVIPARRARRRTIRRAPCRFSRCRPGLRKFGLFTRSPTVRSIARAIRGASGTGRDVLGESDAGQAWLELYRQVHPALLGRIAADETFRARVTQLVAMAAALASDPDSVLSDDHIRHALLVIADLAEVAPEHLRPQLQAASQLFLAMSGLNAEAVLAAIAEHRPS